MQSPRSTCIMDIYIHTHSGVSWIIFVLRRLIWNFWRQKFFDDYMTYWLAKSLPCFLPASENGSESMVVPSSDVFIPNLLLGISLDKNEFIVHVRKHIKVLNCEWAKKSNKSSSSSDIAPAREAIVGELRAPLKKNIIPCNQRTGFTTSNYCAQGLMIIPMCKQVFFFRNNIQRSSLFCSHFIEATVTQMFFVQKTTMTCSVQISQGHGISTIYHSMLVQHQTELYIY